MKFRFLLSTLCQVVQIAEDEAGLVDLSSLEDELKVRETTPWRLSTNTRAQVGQRDIIISSSTLSHHHNIRDLPNMAASQRADVEDRAGQTTKL